MPLSDIIRSMQLNNSAALKQSTQADSEAVLFDAMYPKPDIGIIPKWRQPGLHNQNRSVQPREAVSYHHRRESQTAPRRRKPVFSDPKMQTVILPSFQISLPEASSLFRTKTSTLIDLLRGMGEDMPGVDEDSWMLSPDALGMLALELGITFENATVKNAVVDDEALLMQRRAAATIAPETVVVNTTPTYESYPHRPPVVCIMGHVDHGKTTLMDALRRRASGADDGGKTKKKSKDKKREKGTKGPKHPGDVAGTEAGGITQVISAFQIPLTQEASKAPAVTFLDTPGHAAFTAMRQSGSDAADIIVLVVAADDGVSEQTIEILDFYKSIVKEAGSGGISLVVAMNKIDKPGVELEESTLRIQSQLLEHGVLTEGMPSDNSGDYGPAVQMIPVSGLTGAGLDDLIEGIALQSEIMDLRAPVDTRAEGIVMDARVDKGVGIVADCIIRWGSIQKGDVVVSGTSKGKVRLLKDPANAPLKLGLPSQPVRIIGFDEAPKAGDPIVCVESEEIADDLVTRRKAAADASGVATANGQSLELQSSGRHMMRHEWKEALEKKYGMDQEDGTSGDGPVRIPVVIKADADGTLAAIRDSLLQIGATSSQNIVIEPVKLGVGPVLATEIQIAKECNAAIVCFNLKNEQVITNLADENGVSLLLSDVIYTLLDEARVEFAKYLEPVPVEVVHGRAKVQAVFAIGGKTEKVAGLQVLEGALFKDKVKVKGESFKSTCQYRVLRDGKTIVDNIGASSLKHFKDDVEEVGRGKECGLSLTDHDDYEKGDEIECFSIEMKRPAI
jgi:translation initiation factor IF-2